MADKVEIFAMALNSLKVMHGTNAQLNLPPGPRDSVSRQEYFVEVKNKS